MPELPEPISHTTLAMDAALVAKARSGDSAGVPMSDVGNPCDRAIWYRFRWCHEPEQPDARRERRFRTGNQYETWLLDDLEATGVELWRIDPTTGKQFRAELANGHLRGKVDGAVVGLVEAPKTPHVVECKSHKAESFRKVAKHGLRKAKPEHYAQCQLYMHALGLTRCLYIYANKDDDDEKAERIAYDPAFCLALVSRIERIVHSAKPLVRLHDDPQSKAAFACQWCPAFGQCHGGQFARHNCRTCLHSSPADGGGWTCARWDKALSYEEQKAGCPAHRYIPDLVPGEQVDVIADDVIVYRLQDGSEWRDGERPEQGRAA